MDTYDIFKKLSKGLTFKQRVLGVSNYENKSEAKDVKKEDIKVKEEVVSESDDEESVDDLYEHSEPESDNHSDDEQLQLVEGVEVPGKKKKKKNKKEKPADLAKKLELEEHNRFRNEHGIKCVGRHVPAALKDFDDLMLRYKVSEELVKTVRQCGYSEPTPVQRQAVPCMLEDRQILACAPTGSGKTAAFILPLLHSLGAPQGGPRALILCPTRELAHQIYREALRLSESVQLRISVLHNLKESKVKEREATFKKSDIVITTPNRLCYLLNQENLGITLEKVRWLIIDEADKLFEGSTDQENEFRQQLEQILTSCAHKERRVAMFSATHTPAVAKWCRHQMKGLINITVGQRNAATNLVDQELLFCGNESGKLVAFRQLVQKGLKPPVLVFVQSKDRARQLFKELIYDGINVDVIHADRTQAQRDNVVRSFRVGRIWVLICTELMGRGIDFRGVNLVVNYDFPPSAISYIHRIGRAGRAGTRGNAITFFTQDDVVNLRSIASVMKQSGCAVPDFMLAIKQDHNKRKRLLTHAPHRDRISTVLEKKADKRKLEADKILEKDKNDNKKNHKNAKRRKIQNGDTSEDFIKVKKNKNGKKDRKFVANKKHINGKVPNGAKNNKKGKKNGALNKKVK